ncbi:hypothetical protein ACFFRR_003381 [Megaselia abdita]
MKPVICPLVVLVILVQCECRVLDSRSGLFDSLSKDQKSSEEEDLNKRNFLIVVSFDGFRNEYLKRGVTPNLLRFQEQGVHAPYMKNVFPTKTFTNHHSISTGSYPKHHGVLGNEVYDKVKGKLKYGYDLFHLNQSVLPIWTMNQLAGGKSGCMMWPGSNYEYSGIKCSYNQNYSADVPLMGRVDTMIEWLTKEKDPPNLVMFYSEQPDKLAHVVGPEAQNITDMVAHLDQVTGYIQKQLELHNLSSRANVVHLSDHGMAEVKPPGFINLTDIIAPFQYDYYGTSPVLQIVPKDLSQTTDIYNKLNKASEDLKNFKVYTKDNILPKWHMYNEQRFGPIVVVAEENYAFDDMWVFAKIYEEKLNVPLTNDSDYGVHGYDNDDELMHALFMAKGVDFKTSSKIEVFESVELLELFAKILNINTTEIRLKHSSNDDVSITIKYFQSE